MGVARPGHVPIPAQDPGLGEQDFHLVLDSLGADAQELYPGAVALAAALGHGPLGVALMAQKALLGAVVGQRRLAAAAAHQRAAVPALDEGGGAATVEEQNGLLPFLERGCQPGLEGAAEDAAVP